ncbi:MAG TPA: hypothetical protein VFM18_20885 [Methanosarcina sp.]|nr:hypothetical protein [Methanosarcina sp.]
MRCQCCNKILNDYEATRRHAITNQFLDICNKCIKDLGIPTIERTDLKPNEEMVDDMEEEYVESSWDDGLPEVS